MNDIIEDEAVDFVAALFSTNESKGQGYVAGPRWWCLRADLKEKHREQARQEIKKWAEAERKVALEMGKIGE